MAIAVEKRHFWKLPVPVSHCLAPSTEHHNLSSRLSGVVGPHFRSHRHIFLAELGKHNDDFVSWVWAQKLKAANCRRYFPTVRALEQEWIADLEAFVANGGNAGNENDPATRDYERLGDREESAWHLARLIMRFFR
jgi:hypothetical protein